MRSGTFIGRQERAISPEEILSLNLGIAAPAGVTDFKGFYGDSNYGCGFRTSPLDQV